MTESSGRVEGALRLRFERPPGDSRTVLASAEQRAPLAVVRAFALDGGGALVHLHNLSGGVLGGDRLRLELEVGPGAWAQVTTTGATRVYRTLPSAETPIETRVARVASGGLLEYLPDPLIPFAGVRYRQETRIDLEPEAGLFWWETVAPGRAARGEIFGYERLDLRLEIRAGGRLAAMERARLEPRQRPLDSPARLGPYRYFATFYAWGRKVARSRSAAGGACRRAFGRRRCGLGREHARRRGPGCARAGAPGARSSARVVRALARGQAGPLRNRGGAAAQGLLSDRVRKYDDIGTR